MATPFDPIHNMVTIGYAFMLRMVFKVNYHLLYILVICRVCRGGFSKLCQIQHKCIPVTGLITDQLVLLVLCIDFILYDNYMVWGYFDNNVNETTLPAILRNWP